LAVDFRSRMLGDTPTAVLPADLPRNRQGSPIPMLTAITAIQDLRNLRDRASRRQFDSIWRHRERTTGSRWHMNYTTVNVKFAYSLYRFFRGRGGGGRESLSDVDKRSSVKVRAKASCLRRREQWNRSSLVHTRKRAHPSRVSAHLSRPAPYFIREHRDMPANVHYSRTRRRPACIKILHPGGRTGLVAISARSAELYVVC